jgi:hypothetical protein
MMFFFLYLFIPILNYFLYKSKIKYDV